MLIALPIAQFERERAFRLVRWIAELGAGRKHDCVAILSRDTGFWDEIEPLLKEAFVIVDHHVIPHEEGGGWNPSKSGDATSANNMFLWGSSYCHDVLNRAFLWNETDAIPTRKTSYDEIESEYLQCGKPFMGCKISNGNYHDYLNGVAIYPVEMRQLGVSVTDCGNMAWDVASGSKMIPHAHCTTLIQNYHWLWNKPDPGVCHAAEKWDGVSALFHQCKCGCLIDWLRSPKPELTQAKLDEFYCEILNDTGLPAIFSIQEAKTTFKVTFNDGRIEIVDRSRFVPRPVLIKFGKPQKRKKKHARRPSLQSS